MSRSYKDTPWKLRYPEQQWDYKYAPNENHRWSWLYALQQPGVLTKKKRSYVEYHGMPTPMWWIREFMTQPQRTRGREWERQIVKYAVEDLVDVDTPSVSRKPHLYYW
jgi:TATA-binding protein-associated factor Taf7